jgi:hypothetical protein
VGAVANLAIGWHGRASAIFSAGLRAEAETPARVRRGRRRQLATEEAESRLSTHRWFGNRKKPGPTAGAVAGGYKRTRGGKGNGKFSPERLELTDVAWRISDFSTPFFGVQWGPPAVERETATTGGTLEPHRWLIAANLSDKTPAFQA